MTHRALIVEDDPDIARLVQLQLRDIDCRGDIVADGHAALRRAAEIRYDVVILDLMLPGLDGLAVCRKLRQRDDYLPVLMLTAKSSELDRVLGLEMGADDYLVKPFSILELNARIKALLRRAQHLGGTAAGEEQIARGDLLIDTLRRRVSIAGQPVELTAREFDLLLHFARHPGRVFTRAQLLDTVWGYGHAGYEHTVNTHINRLRAKIESEPHTPRRIVTVWGVGYQFAEP
jgi:DNA-binding response OmpR family regulator